MWAAGDESEDDVFSVNRRFSGAQILFHTVVGEVMGVSPTDSKCLDLLLQARTPLTAGALAKLSGLTTGAITGVIDRLERRGFVRRSRDRGDRRRVQVTPVDGVEATIGRIFDPLRASLMQMLDDEFDAREREAIHRYLLRCTDLLREETHRLRASVDAEQPGE